jgi:hypothetical protein
MVALRASVWSDRRAQEESEKTHTMGRLYSGGKPRDFGGDGDPGLVEPVRERFFEVELGAVVGASISTMIEVGVRAMIVESRVPVPREIGNDRRHRIVSTSTPGQSRKPNLSTVSDQVPEWTLSIADVPSEIAAISIS